MLLIRSSTSFETIIAIEVLGFNLSAANFHRKSTYDATQKTKTLFGPNFDDNILGFDHIYG